MVKTTKQPEIIVHQGQCHCGAVKFEFPSPKVVDVTHCNCSLCHMAGYQHVFIPREDVTFTQGKDALTLYTFGTHTAEHFFCKTCGIKPLYRPRSHPKAWSVNLRCVVGDTLSVRKTIDFDGQNWDKNIAALRKET